MRGSDIDVAPLSIPMSRVLGALTRDYDGAAVAPPIELFAALLRLSADGPFEQRELPERARISRRAATAALQNAERRGWVTLEPSATRARGRTVVFTPNGLRAAVAGKGTLEAIESSWRTQHPAVCDDVRPALEQLVARFDLELPHYPITYGLGDLTFTGGDHVSGKPGPPRVPPHGNEWRPVLRREHDAVADLPLTALLSQALVQYTIDYDSAGRGTLHAAVNVLRHFPSRPLPITGDGTSFLERHGIATASADGARLTPLGTYHLESFAPLVLGTEERWAEAYGSQVVDRVRSGLTTLVGTLDGDLPDHLAVGIASWG